MCLLCEFLIHFEMVGDNADADDCDRFIDEVLKYFERRFYMPKPIEVRAKKE